MFDVGRGFRARPGAGKAIGGAAAAASSNACAAAQNLQKPFSQYSRDCLLPGRGLARKDMWTALWVLHSVLLPCVACPAIWLAWCFWLWMHACLGRRGRGWGGALRAPLLHLDVDLYEPPPVFA